MKTTFQYGFLLLLFLGVLSCSSDDNTTLVSAEICANGIDDDGDGQTDCADGDCFESEDCFAMISDQRLKDNISLLEYGLAETLQLNPKRYTYIADEAAEERMGFMAQEVQLLMPELVSVDTTNKHLKLKYIDIMAVLVNAIKEQQEIIEANQQQIESLRCEIENKNYSQ